MLQLSYDVKCNQFHFFAPSEHHINLHLYISHTQLYVHILMCLYLWSATDLV
jgi:hypothetical protein